MYNPANTGSHFITGWFSIGVMLGGLAWMPF